MGGNLKESLKNQTKHCFPKKLETLLKVILNQVEGGGGMNQESQTIVTNLQFQRVPHAFPDPTFCTSRSQCLNKSPEISLIISPKLI